MSSPLEPPKAPEAEDTASEIDSAHFFFEGVEKSLEIDFVPGHCKAGMEKGLRNLTRAQLDDLCTAAKCTIISTMSNDHVDSYVLSESSLFVYPFKIILKTCGTTTLLMCLEPLLEATKQLGMKVEWVAYTRKDFQRPGQQKFPHRDHNEESAFLKQFFPDGNTFILGPITADHWVVFVADYLDRNTDGCVDRTLDMMMFGIDQEVAKLFVQDKTRFPKDSDVTRASGIDTLLPGSMIQEFCFDPCGYSMNGLLYDSYWTIHITPEATFSYASFETNIRMPSYAGLIKAVLAIFKPKKWTMTLFADNGGLKALRETPFSQVLPVPVIQSTHRAIMGPCVITKDLFGNTVVEAELNASAPAASPKAPSPTPAAGVPSAETLAAALLGSTTAVPEPLLISAQSVPAAGQKSPGGSGGTPRASTNTSGATSAGAISYVMTTKSQTEFVGEYSALFGIYALVHSNSNAGASFRSVLPAVADAAGDSLSLPRAKYVVAKRVEEIAKKSRTESI